MDVEAAEAAEKRYCSDLENRVIYNSVGGLKLRGESRSSLVEV